MDPQGIPDRALGTTSLWDYPEFLEHEIQTLNVKPIIVGHSMGGLLDQILGAREPAKALVLLTPASPAGIMALKPSVIRSFWSILKLPIQSTGGNSCFPNYLLFQRFIFSYHAKA